MGQCLSSGEEARHEDNVTHLPKYELMGELGAGRKGEIKLMRNARTQELVAVKYILRQTGVGLSVNTERELVNHRKLLHPNIIRFKEVYFDETYLAIVMEYASQGHLSAMLKRQGKLSETDARRFFQQLIDGVEYCHREGVVHRDLRMEHLLLDGSIYSPVLKITGFGYSKSEILDSQPKSSVGTPAYVPPEVLMAKDSKSYDGQAMDVWACGVILFLMLTGSFPFQNGSNGGLLTRKMIRDVNTGRLHYPQGIQVHAAARDLLKKILTPNPKERATLAQIQQHKWVMADQASPKKLGSVSSQSPEDIARIVNAARIEPVQRSNSATIEDEVTWPEE